MILSRRLSHHLDELKRYYPILSVTGPRQSGKTTLLRAHFDEYRYVNFELPRVRLSFEEDPVGFLKEYNDYVIFDEAQHVPALFSYLQVNVDDERRPGRFILSGSQDFLLCKNITQSLAGRIGIARLLPFDLAEFKMIGEDLADPMEVIFNGFYPGKIKEKLPTDMFYESYLYSYVQRDVARLVNPSNLTSFNRFLIAVVGSAGQLINFSNLANLVGVDVKTIQSWISILEQSYIIFRLSPYFKSISRRLVKSPKLYFYDTGLLCYLLGIRAPSELRGFHLYGNVFENFIVADAFKSAHHNGNQPWYEFYRDSNGKEIDLVYSTPAKTLLWEIKATMTYHPRLTKQLRAIATDVFPGASKRLVFAGEGGPTLNDVTQTSWQDIEWP